MRILLLIIISLFTFGCADAQVRNWHNERIYEIETAYQNKEITTGEYLQLKQETDRTLFDYKSRVRAGVLSSPIYQPPQRNN